MCSPSAALWQYHRRARREVGVPDAVMVGGCMLSTTLPPLRPELTVGFNATCGAADATASIHTNGYHTH